MRLNQHVRYGDLAREIASFLRVPGVLVSADIVPRPPIELAFANMRDIVRRKIVAENVALVDGAPERGSLRLDGQPRTIANPGGEDTHVTAVGIEGEHIGAIFLGSPGRADRVGGLECRDSRSWRLRHRFGDVRTRADRDEHG